MMLTVSRNYGILVSEKGKVTHQTEGECTMANLTSVEIIKLNNGYYVEKRRGPNCTREYCKSMKAATALKKKWEGKA